MQTTAMVRPERDEELRIEADGRATAGPWSYPGTRDCPACESESVPVHPNHTDRQSCGTCGTDLPGDPVTWAIREDPERGWTFILRHGDYCASAAAPPRMRDIDVDRALAGNVWLNLEVQLGIVAVVSAPWH